MFDDPGVAHMNDTRRDLVRLARQMAAARRNWNEPLEALAICPNCGGGLSPFAPHECRKGGAQ